MIFGGCYARHSLLPNTSLNDYLAAGLQVSLLTLQMAACARRSFRYRPEATKAIIGAIAEKWGYVRIADLAN